MLTPERIAAIFLEQTGFDIATQDAAIEDFACAIQREYESTLRVTQSKADEQLRSLERLREIVNRRGEREERISEAEAAEPNFVSKWSAAIRQLGKPTEATEICIACTHGVCSRHREQDHGAPAASAGGGIAEIVEAFRALLKSGEGKS